MAKQDVRQNGRDITKMYTEIVKDEKKTAHRRLRLRSACPHRMDDKPTLKPQRQPDGRVIFKCQMCGQMIDLTTIQDGDLQKAIDTIVRACDFIKMTAGTSERDRRLVEEVISEIEFMAQAFMRDAYKAARGHSTKKFNKNGRRNTGKVTWDG